MKFKIAYISLLVVLAILMGFAMVRPAATGDQYSEVSKENLFKTDNGYVVAFDIMNHEGTETRYTVRVSSDRQLYSEDFSIQDGGKFTYAYNVYREQFGQGKLNLSIFKTGQSAPFEQVDYYLK